MGADGLAKLIEAAAKLLGVLIWPAIILYVLVRFGSNVGEFISSLGEITLKFAGLEASATRQKNEAAAALSVAALSNPEGASTPEAAKSATRDAMRIVRDLSPRRIRQVDNAQVLWVDDRPLNNIYEKQSLEALGIKFVISKSTDDAMEKIKSQKFDTIISDMGRPPDDQAGYTLLDRLRSSGNHIPYIIYTSSRSPEHQAEAERRGALGCTNQPAALFEMVLSALPR